MSRPLPGQLGLPGLAPDVPAIRDVRVRKARGLFRWLVTWSYDGTVYERGWGSPGEASWHAERLRRGVGLDLELEHRRARAWKADRA